MRKVPARMATDLLEDMELAVFMSERGTPVEGFDLGIAATRLRAILGLDGLDLPPRAAYRVEEHDK